MVRNLFGHFVAGTFDAHYAQRSGGAAGWGAQRTDTLYENRSEPLNAENNNSINYAVYGMKNKGGGLTESLLVLRR